VAQLQEHHQLQERLKQSFGIGRKPPMPASVSTYALFGLILLGVGVYLSFTRPGIDFLTFAMSAVFFVMAGASYKRYRDACLTC
jgi:sulfite exporter TauE/SafE